MQHILSIYINEVCTHIRYIYISKRSLAERAAKSAYDLYIVFRYCLRTAQASKDQSTKPCLEFTKNTLPFSLFLPSPHLLLQPASTDDNDTTTTTTEAYSISRYELGRILGRNFRGVQRLAQMEFKEALNVRQSTLF